MACIFNISQFVPLFNGGTFDGFTIQGTVYNPSGPTCRSLEISISCGSTVYESTVSVSLLTPSLGYFSGTFADVPDAFLECCNQNIEISIGCPACGYQTYMFPMFCPNGESCPLFTSISCTPGPCRFDGTVELTCAAQIFVTTATDVQWTLDGNLVGAPVVLTSSGSITTILTVPGDGQPHTVGIKVIKPEGCPPISVTIETPACEGACPPAEITHRAGDCKSDGTRDVTIVAVLTAALPNAPVDATLAGPFGTVSGSDIGTLTLTSTGSLGAGTYTVTVTAGDCPPQTYTFDVEDCCPKITFNRQIGDCNADGTRDVTITAILDAGSSATQIDAAMTSPLGVVPGSGVGSLTLSDTGAFAAGTHDVTVQAGKCPPQTFSFDVEDCCPEIAIDHEVGSCNVDGTRNVVVTATLTAGPSTPIDAVLTGPFGTVPGTDTGSLTLTDSGALPAGTYTVTVQAGICPSQSHTFEVEDCCPTVQFEHVVLGLPLCSPDKTRPVQITATVTPHTGVQTSATLIDVASGSILATGNGSAPFTLTGSGDYESGSHTVQVEFAQPSTCPPQTYILCVPPCESFACFTLRNLILISASLVFSSIVLLLATSISGILDLGSPPPGGLLFGRCQDLIANAAVKSNLQTMAVIAAAAAIGLFIWWALCFSLFGVKIGGCCRQRCLIRLILWQSLFMSGIIVLWFLSCSWLFNIIFAAILFLLAFLFFLWWKNDSCCSGKCDPLFYLVVALTLALVESIVLLAPTGIGGACVDAPNTLSLYPALYISVLEIVTVAVRALIGLWYIVMLARLIQCLVEGGRVLSRRALGAPGTRN